MELNTTNFSSAAEIAPEEVPEYLTYLMLLILSAGIPLVIIPALMVIVIVVKNKKMQNNKNFFLVNLVLADMSVVLVKCCTNGLLMILYLLDFTVDADCTLLMMPAIALVIASKLMFLPMCVDRFIHIAFPFSYKQVVTAKAIIITIIALWMVVIFMSYFLVYDKPFEYIPSLGICKPKQINILYQSILIGSFFMPVLPIIITSIYLRYRIIRSNNFFHSVKRNAAQERKSLRAGRLAEILQEQVKPTLSVFILGGTDAVVNILFVLIFAIATFLSPTNTMAYIVTAQFMAVPVHYIQSVNHSLVYNKSIRENITICCKQGCNKQSKVIMLNRDAQICMQPL